MGKLKRAKQDVDVGATLVISLENNAHSDNAFSTSEEKEKEKEKRKRDNPKERQKM